jgi:hypothetical protein
MPDEPVAAVGLEPNVSSIQGEGALMGRPRFEQLSRLTGHVRVGDEAHELPAEACGAVAGCPPAGSLSGPNLAVGRVPDGRTFGYICSPSRDDGKPTLNEGHVFEGDGG